jgi:16S rRNA (cytosine1402-N4)-methyltransferase
MAIRIFVNDEIGALHTAINTAIDRTSSGGRIVVLTYQSLEGGETKGLFRQASGANSGSPFPSEETGPKVRLLTKKVVKPSIEEMERNPRSRSAMLRAVEKL